MDQLFNGLPLPDASDKALVAKGYVIAIQGYPEWAIADAVRNYIRGIVPGQSLKYSPRAPELSAVIRKALEHVYDDIARTRREAEHRKEQAGLRRVETPVKTEPKLGAVLEENVGHAEWQAYAKARKYPAGALWIARTGRVHAPHTENACV